MKEEEREKKVNADLEGSANMSKHVLINVAFVAFITTYEIV